MSLAAEMFAGGPIGTSKQEKSNLRIKREKELRYLLAQHSVDWMAVRNVLLTNGVIDELNQTEDDTLMTTAHRCAYDGATYILRECIRAGCDVNAKTRIGRSLLHYACDANRPECVRLLLELGADANGLTLSCQTPLHLCCVYGSYEALVELVASAREPLILDGEDAHRQTPEDINSDPRIAQAFLDCRAKLEDGAKSQLVEHALRCLFDMFDKEGHSYILPEECVCSLLLFARHLGGGGGPDAADVIAGAKLSFDGVVSWEEFKEEHTAMAEALQVTEYRLLSERLRDLEAAVQAGTVVTALQAAQVKELMRQYVAVARGFSEYLDDVSQPSSPCARDVRLMSTASLLEATVAVEAM